MMRNVVELLARLFWLPTLLCVVIALVWLFVQWLGPLALPVFLAIFVIGVLMVLGYHWAEEYW